VHTWVNGAYPGVHFFRQAKGFFSRILGDNTNGYNVDKTFTCITTNVQNMTVFYNGAGGDGSDKYVEHRNANCSHLQMMRVGQQDLEGLSPIR
jgi:hypothetical protein